MRRPSWRPSLVPSLREAKRPQPLYVPFCESTLTPYRDQQPIFANAQVMPLKVTRDDTYDRSLLAPLYFTGHISDIVLLGRLKPAPLHVSSTAPLQLARMQPP